jgi:hypothetical protein
MPHRPCQHPVRLFIADAIAAPRWDRKATPHTCDCVRHELTNRERELSPAGAAEREIPGADLHKQAASR